MKRSIHRASKFLRDFFDFLRAGYSLRTAWNLAGRTL